MIDRTWELMEKYLDGDFRILPMAPNQSSEQDIQDVENKLGIKLPEDYRTHLLGVGDEVLDARGICVEVIEAIWPRPKELEVGPFWTFLYAFYTLTACKQSEEWMRLDYAGMEFFENTGIKAVPILQVMGDADPYCVDENSQIVIYRHEENIIEPTGKTFWEVLEFELKELKKRKEMKIEENKQ